MHEEEEKRKKNAFIRQENEGLSLGDYKEKL